MSRTMSFGLSVLAAAVTVSLAWAMASMVQPAPAAAQTSAAPELADGEVRRLAGADRWTTAAENAERLWPDGAETALLATGFDYPDALAGAALAAVEDGPLLLTPANELTDEVRDTLTRLGPERVILLGGPSAVSQAVADEVRALPGEPQVERVAGADRFATASEAYQAAGSAVGGDAAVATGFDFPDALAAGSLTAGAAPVPVMLATAEAVQGSVGDASRALLVGGTGVIPPAVEEDARGQTGQVRRLAGATRWGTSLEVADFALTQRLDGEVPLVVATGEDFPDALAAGAAAGRVGAPLLLVPSAGPTEGQREWLQANRDRLVGAWVIGGSAAVSSEAVDEIADALNEPEDPDDIDEPGEQARIGDAITLATQDGGEIEVTVHGLHDPAEAGEFQEPEEGERYAAVELTITNTGNQTYDDTPDNSGTLVDATDAGHRPSLSEVGDCESFQRVRISPQDQRRGCLVFELAEDREPRLFQFTPDSGFGPDTGEWDLTQVSDDPHDPGEPTGPVDAGSVGDTFTLATQDGGEIEVTVEDIHDPAQPGELDEPNEGERSVAVELTIANTGDQTYDDAPDNGGTLVDDEHVAHHTALSQVEDCDSFNSVTISPDDQRRGCLVFELAEDRGLRLFQFTADSGFGPDTGEWQL